jgi:hypothetical protein
MWVVGTLPHTDLVGALIIYPLCPTWDERKRQKLPTHPSIVVPIIVSSQLVSYILEQEIVLSVNCANNIFHQILHKVHSLYLKTQQTELKKTLVIF